MHKGDELNGKPSGLTREPSAASIILLVKGGKVASSSSEASPGLSFSSLTVSPYAVGETMRRERWWFSDGIWLNQGKSAAVVGYAWTQWLADRGVEPRDGVLGDEY